MWTCASSPPLCPIHAHARTHVLCKSDCTATALAGLRSKILRNVFPSPSLITTPPLTFTLTLTPCPLPSPWQPSGGRGLELSATEDCRDDRGNRGTMAGFFFLGFDTASVDPPPPVRCSAVLRAQSRKAQRKFGPLFGVATVVPFTVTSSAHHVCTSLIAAVRFCPQPGQSNEELDTLLFRRLDGLKHRPQGLSSISPVRGPVDPLVHPGLLTHTRICAQSSASGDPLPSSVCVMFDLKLPRVRACPSVRRGATSLQCTATTG